MRNRTTDIFNRMQSSTWAVPVALFLLALLVRLPKLTTIPAPTDETDELLVALEIVKHGAHTLTTSEPYLGPLFVYLLAGSYAILGPSFVASRVVALICGALVAPAAWAFGRAAHGQAAGIVAGLVMLFAFGPVVLGSHVAWSHGAAPTFVALAMAALVMATRAHNRRRYCIAAGFTMALAVGAHPTVGTLAVGAGIWWLVTGRRELRARIEGGAWVVGAFLLGYAPILVYLAMNGVEPFKARLGAQDYAGQGAANWPQGVALWIESLARNLAGPALAAVNDPRMWLSLALILVALGAATRGGRWLPLAVVGSGALLMPLLVDGSKYISLTGLRSAAPALPAAAVAIGVWAQEAWSGGEGRRRTVVLGLVAVLLFIQAWSIARFYQVTEATGVTGEPVVAVVDGLIAGAADRDTLFIDEDIDTKLIGGGEVGRVVAALLTLDGTAYTKAKADKIRWFLANGNGSTYDLVLAGDTADVLGAEFALEPVRVVPVAAEQVSRSGDHWGWYRMRTRRP